MMFVSSDGWLEVGGKRYECALGKGGVCPEADKREGDGKTPLGTYPLRRVFWRRDKLAGAPKTHLPLVEITRDMGWCDAPEHPLYNQLVLVGEGTLRPHPVMAGSNAMRPSSAASEDGTAALPKVARSDESKKLPSHEKMWREEDDCYDLVVELGHNDNPPTPGLGSAIFMHIAKKGYPPTEGCMALKLEDLLEVLESEAVTLRII